MARTLILHLGAHKTGSSSIQATLAGGAEALAMQDVALFEPGQSSARIYAAFHDDLSRNHMVRNWGVDSVPAQRAFGAEMRRSFADWLAQATQSTLMLSSENLVDFAPEAVRDMARLVTPLVDHVRLIVFLRAPYSYANSMAQQLIRGGATFADLAHVSLDLRETTQPRLVRASILPGFEARLAPWLDAFGEDAVEIHRFAPDRFPGGSVVAAFFDAAFGALPEALGVQGRVVNEALDHGSTLLLEALNRVVPPFVDGRLNPARSRRLKNRVLAAQSELAGMAGMAGRQPFRLPDFDWDRFDESVAPDLDWLGMVTQERIRFTLDPAERPVPHAGAVDLSVAAALLNSLSRDHDREAGESRAAYALLKHQTGRGPGRSRLEAQIGELHSPARALDIAQSLLSAGETDLATRALRRADALAAPDDPIRRRVKRLEKRLGGGASAPGRRVD
ncbi:MAG: hypothetical protein AAFR46_05620 [Pseudomonadota bacterium]